MVVLAFPYPLVESVLLPRCASGLSFLNTNKFSITSGISLSTFYLPVFITYSCSLSPIT
jgi:hypothetical protein